MFNTPKVRLYALYLLNSVLFADLYSSKGKGLQENALNEEQAFYFRLRLKHFIFFHSCS